jgi:hypothetical protein
MSLPPMEELFVFLLLLLGVVGIYFLLKLHYVFAFKLVQKTDIYKSKKETIEKIKTYLFMMLKALLVLGLVAMFIFCFSLLRDGQSLEVFVLGTWQKIPEGFWLTALLTIVRIAILIVVSKFVLKYIYKFLDKKEAYSLKNTTHKPDDIKNIYILLHNSIKYAIVLGVIYRITRFFPSLLWASWFLLFVLSGFVLYSLFKMSVLVYKIYYN